MHHSLVHQNNESFCHLSHNPNGFLRVHQFVIVNDVLQSLVTELLDDVKVVFALKDLNDGDDVL